MELVRHNIKVHFKTYENIILCSKCPGTFLNQSLLNIHFGRMHAPETESRFQCLPCQKRFDTAYELRLHQRASGHTPRNIRVTCLFCTEGQTYYRDKTKFLRHMCKHTGERFNFCPFCQAEFMSKQALEKHLDLHNLERFKKIRVAY